MRYNTPYKGKLGYKFFRNGGEYNTQYFKRLYCALKLPFVSLWKVVYPTLDENKQWKYKTCVLNLIASKYQIIRTVHGNEARALDTYKDFHTRIPDLKPWEVVMWSVYSKDGGYIGDIETTYIYMQRGITDIQKGTPIDRTCSIGFNAEEQKWYGWSHRAMCGFGVGSQVVWGDVLVGKYAVGHKAQNLEDCKNMATAFAGEVS